MITRKFLMCGILGAATLFSSASYAFYHRHHHDRPRFEPRHYHPNVWRNNNIHHWAPRGNYIEVPASGPYSQNHYHR